MELKTTIVKGSNSEDLVHKMLVERLLGKEVELTEELNKLDALEVGGNYTRDDVQVAKERGEKIVGSFERDTQMIAAAMP